MKYQKISILGMGLIGGAIGLDLKSKGLADEVVGWGRNAEHLKQAVQAGACNRWTESLSDAVKGADIIILATPPEIILKQIKSIIEYLSAGTLIMDAASVKSSVGKVADEFAIKYKEKKAEFLGCHPIAGSEKTGVKNAYTLMFKDAPVILTPSTFNTEEGIEKGKVFWELLEARVVILSSSEHDLIMGFLSHLPHIISMLLMKSSFEKIKNTDTIQKMAGPSFKEMTRIAGASPEIWKEIYLENLDNVLQAIEIFEENIGKFKQLLLKKDAEHLKDFLNEAVLCRKKCY